jgi:putative N6-adenine-specific DNA methylase
MNKQVNLIATTAFGLESVVKREIKNLGYEIDSVENGRVHFSGDIDAIINANLWLRCADRILLKMGEFKAYNFDELFEKTKALPWGDWIGIEDEFPAAKITSVQSNLFSKSDGQRIVKKAVVECLKQKYRLDWFQETGAKYPIHINILKDRVTLSIDTSGTGLHKRGYRKKGNEAPLRETLAAALVYLSRWEPHRPLADPLCGSGTILIEAAMIGKNMSPGLNRSFVSEEWRCFSSTQWDEARYEAKEKINDRVFMLRGSDVDGRSLNLAKNNAKEAGVSEYISFSRGDVKDFTSEKQYGVIITNPPYGERLGDVKELNKLYAGMGKAFMNLEDWSYFILTSYDYFENYFGKKATKNRKLYNGKIKTYFYQYLGRLPRLNKSKND